jgi:hypothetical protein
MMSAALLAGLSAVEGEVQEFEVAALVLAVGRELVACRASGAGEVRQGDVGAGLRIVAGRIVG